MRITHANTVNAPASTSGASTAPQPTRLAFSMKETAELLGVNYQTVYRLSKRGLLKSSSALRIKLFPLAEIQRFLKV
jgi:hypothetical protein